MEYETLLARIKEVVDEAAREAQPELEGMSYVLLDHGEQVAAISEGDYPGVISIHTMGLYPKDPRPAVASVGNETVLLCPNCNAHLRVSSS